MDMSLPMLFCVGTYYEVGFQIGKTFKARIKEFYDLFEDLNDKFIPFYNTDKGKEVVTGYLDVVTTSFPQYLRELKGISDGAQIPFEHVFLMHLRVELQTYLGKEQVPECSTVFVNNEETYALAHNEDTSVLVRNRGYMINVHIREEECQGKHKIKEEKFIAYCYPGVIPGNSMNINFHGFIFTMNALYPSLLQLHRTPRQFINRAVLSASSLEQIREIFLDYGNGIATGCSTNVAYLTNKTTDNVMWNFELAPSAHKELSVLSEVLISRSQESGTAIVAGHYNHFNMYKHMKVQEIPGRTTSSVHRQKSADNLPVPKTIHGMLQVLGDTADKDYPIYRTPSASDAGATVATGLFDLKNSELIVYVDNPKTSSSPVLRLKLSPGSEPFIGQV